YFSEELSFYASLQPGLFLQDQEFIAVNNTSNNNFNEATEQSNSDQATHVKSSSIIVSKWNQLKGESQKDLVVESKNYLVLVKKKKILILILSFPKKEKIG
ncbi:24811_t:CDS:2, partial [Gigaspora margarita]